MESEVFVLFSAYTGNRTRIVGDPNHGNVGRLQVYQYGWWGGVSKTDWNQIGAQVSTVFFTLLL